MTPEPAAVLKMREKVQERTPAEIIQWIREQPTMDQAVQILATYAAAQHQEWEAAWAAAELPRLVASEAHVALANQVNTLRAQLAAAEGELISRRRLGLIDRDRIAASEAAREQAKEALVKMLGYANASHEHHEISAEEQVTQLWHMLQDTLAALTPGAAAPNAQP